MKIIDLLNKIANGEEVPKKIKYKNDIYKYEAYDYFGINKGYFFDRYNVSEMLNDTVEILEEEKKLPEKIEEEEIIEVSMGIGEQICANKINEIIDYLKSKGE